MNIHKDSTGEGISKSVSLHNSNGSDNRQQDVKASRSNGEDLCDKYALEIHVSSKKNDKIQLAKSAPDNTKCIT